MTIELTVRTNPAPCKHTVVTVTEDGVSQDMVFHDSEFDAEQEPVDRNEVKKALKEKLTATGKRLSQSKPDLHNKKLKRKFEDNL